MATYCVLDLETQNNPYMGHVSNPHNPDNYIVAAGWALDDGEVQSRYFYNAEQANASNWAEEALKNARILVAHNATFELHWLMSRHMDALMQFLKKGGKVFCTQYAEYLLSHQTELYPKLEDTALKYGGSKKIDEVSILWGSGVLTSDIEESLLMQYLAGEEGDVVNTRIACFAQIEALKEQGMLAMFWQRMNSLVFNAFATFNGLKVDLDVANKNLMEHEEDLKAAYKCLDTYLPELPEDYKFSWTSGHQLSALIFGGTIKYDCKVPYDPPKYEKQTCYQTLEGIYVPVQEISSVMPSLYVTYKSGKNKGLPKEFSIDSDIEKLKWGTAEFKFEGLLDLKKLPDSVASQYTGKNASYQGKQTLVCGTPVYSTGRDSLQVLQPYLEMVDKLLVVANLEKDLGTYYIQHKYASDGSIKSSSGMLTLVRPDGIINHSLNNCATVTARLTSNKPNMQNLPRHGTSRVKQMFISRFPEGRLVEVDYTSLEVIVGAAHSHDRNMLKQLSDGTDMHCYRLAGFLNESYEEVLEKCKNHEHPEHEKYDELRTWIKPISFADQYGASANGLAYACGITLEQAEKFKATQLKLFPQMASFAQEHVRPCVEESGKHVILREVSDTGEYRVYHRGYYKAPSGTYYSFREREKYVNGQKIMAYKDTEISNYWCQGEASFIVQAACGAVIRKLIEQDFEGGKVLPINTVHDAIYLDCFSEELAIKWGLIVKELMQATPSRLCAIIPELRDVLYDSVEFPAVPEYGESLYDKKEIKHE